MPLRLDIKRQLSARSDRVKSVDMHPKEPWVLAALYNGKVYIWNYNTQEVVKQFEVTDLPVRCAKFIVRKQWIVAGADDMFVTVHNFNTMEKVTRFEAHSDYIRSIAVHPSLPCILSSSDDMLIKMWNWDEKWKNTLTFEGHTHYVMQVVFNPKDSNMFASASLDKTVKVWGLNTTTPYFTLEGHEKGVNCIDYYEGGDRPYLISGADDKTCKIWDYQTKACVQTLEGHTHNVSCVGFSPNLPLIITGSEDGTVRLWHSTTYRLENTLNYNMERVWAVAYLKGTNNLAFGYDEGAIMIKIGREDPVCSMDSSGKILYAKHSEVWAANVKTVSSEEMVDGERLSIAAKSLSNVEIFPQSMVHNTNGRFVVICGDGEHIIYTALNLRSKNYGSALDFVWSPEKDEYAVRESTSKIKLYKNFKEKTSFKPTAAAQGLYGGTLMAIKSGSGTTNPSVQFYDWEGCRFIMGEATVLSFHCLSLCFSAFPCGSTALTEDRCNQRWTSRPTWRRSTGRRPATSAAWRARIRSTCCATTPRQSRRTLTPAASRPRTASRPASSWSTRSRSGCRPGCSSATASSTPTTAARAPTG
eukprot:SAG22_NODE_1385_length_4533_cov_11.714253_2_plen_586_part_00